MNAALRTHLATGLTTICRCWLVTRSDGVTLGFTDHDRDVSFDGYTFRADTGMTAQTMVQAAGLSVDNTEALGILTDDAVTEADIEAGRYDAAEVRSWLVNWQDPAARELRFRGRIGDIARGAGGFTAELRGLTEALNVAVGRSFHPVCDAELGDSGCKFDVSQPDFQADVIASVVEENRVFRFADPVLKPKDWFTRGVLEVQTGTAAGLIARIREDRLAGADRIISLWDPLRAEVAVGDTLRITAGCDKSLYTCGAKFGNVLNYRGFPHIPGEDWLAAVPRSGEDNDGGSRQS